MLDLTYVQRDMSYYLRKFTFVAFKSILYFSSYNLHISYLVEA